MPPEGARTAARARGQARPPASGAGDDAAAALASELTGGGWDAVWRLAPGVSSPAPDAGRAHADETLAKMLGDAFLDAWALAERPLEALVIGSGEGWLCHRLLELGARRVLGVDARADALRRAELLRGLRAREGSLESLRIEDLGQLDPAAVGTFDVVVVAEPAERIADRGRVLASARRCTRELCAIATGERVEATLAARAAGFESVSLAPIPLDAERRYVLAERALLLARPESRR